jgi:hypothetical protein
MIPNYPQTRRLLLVMQQILGFSFSIPFHPNLKFLTLFMHYMCYYSFPKKLCLHRSISLWSGIVANPFLHIYNVTFKNL